MAAATLLIVNTSASTVLVRAGDDLQQALNAARPGDTLLLDRGSVFTGNFVLPARGGDDSRDVVIRTADDPLMPGEGERISPLASPALAKLQSPNGLPALRTAAGAQHWRIALLEFLPNRSSTGEILALGDGSSAQNAVTKVPSGLTLDRLYIHGDPERGQKRGIALNSGDTTITGCYVSDIKAIGQDSQAIGGWNGTGPYRIENNFLEASGNNVMFGGADPAIIGLTPSHIVVRDNVISKPLAWRNGSGPRWQVKNLFELKNARDVLVERNLMERSWQAAQSGYAILLTVRNQDGGCPWCQVENIQFRKNVVRDVAAGIQITGTDNNHASRRTGNVVISDNLFDKIDRRTWGGDGYFLQITDGPRDVVIDHNTVIQGASNGVAKLDGIADNVSITNNVMSHGDYGIIGTNHAIGNDSIRTFLPGARVTGNVLAGGQSRVYPPGNFFPSLDDFRQQFVSFGSGDYRLAPASAWRGAGTDGRDLGADMSDAMGLRLRRTPPRARRPEPDR